MNMNQQEIFDTIVKNTREVVFELEEHQFKPDDSLKALGANSIDRSEIIMMTLEDMELEVPLIELAKAENITELASILHGKQ